MEGERGRGRVISYGVYTIDSTAKPLTMSIKVVSRVQALLWPVQPSKSCLKQLHTVVKDLLSPGRPIASRWSSQKVLMVWSDPASQKEDSCGCSAIWFCSKHSRQWHFPPMAFMSPFSSNGKSILRVLLLSGTYVTDNLKQSFSSRELFRGQSMIRNEF